MPTLTQTATRLCLALTARYLGPEPTLMDAVAFTAGRPHTWSHWDDLPDDDKMKFVCLIKHRPASLTHTGRFIAAASRILLAAKSPFRLSQTALNPLKLKETDTYLVAEGIDIDCLIDELLQDIKRTTTPQETVKIPCEGPIELREIQAQSYRTFLVPESFRPYLKTEHAPLTLEDAPAPPIMSWSREQLHALAYLLDEAARRDEHSRLHQKHRESLERILQSNNAVEATAGTFYRVNAPTGSGKSVVMLMMAILAAQEGHRIVIAVPTLTDVRNTVEALRAAVAAAAPALRIAPLHSQRRIASSSLHYLSTGRKDHSFDYRCLLDAFSTDHSKSKRDEEPCFNLLMPGVKNGKEVSKRIDHCPFLNQCGKRSMLEQALSSDIVVVNHHALISSTTRIPLEGCGSGSRSVLELLLRTSSLFLVDEIDGLLQSAIDTSVFELTLSNRRQESALASLNTEIFSQDSIPELDDDTLFRAQRASTACILNTTRLLRLAKEHVKWPNRETVWERADDSFISSSLGIESDTIDGVCGYSEIKVPPVLHELQELLRYFSRNDAEPSPEHIVADIGLFLRHLSVSGKLPGRLNDDKLLRLKSALVLRTSLHYLEESLRTLHVDVPLLVRAKLSYAQAVQQDMAGSAPFSPTPLGPLQRIVYGFKRKKSGHNNWSLQVVALRGDPHRTLQYLPELTSLIYAGVKRIFIGFSATAFFPGASSFDLQAKNLIDVPDAEGNIRFENVNVTVAISGSQLDERLVNVRRLGRELWPWVAGKLAALSADPETRNRARLLLVTGSDDEAEELASTLHEMSENLHLVGWARSGKKPDKQSRLPARQKLTYDDLVEFAKGPYTNVDVLVSSIYPIARGHNIVNDDGLSALGAVVVCVRPMPSSDQPANNLAHVCYTIGQRVIPGERPGLVLIQERGLSNRVLNDIRTSPPTFSRQPEEIRHFTIMNVLVTLTQFVGRARRGGTKVTCYLADAAFFDNSRTWADLLEETILKLKTDGHWHAFSRHHAGLVEAMILYIEHARKTNDEQPASDEPFPF